MDWETETQEYLAPYHIVRKELIWHMNTGVSSPLQAVLVMETDPGSHETDHIQSKG